MAYYLTVIFHYDVHALSNHADQLGFFAFVPRLLSFEGLLVYDAQTKRTGI